MRGGQIRKYGINNKQACCNDSNQYCDITRRAAFFMSVILVSNVQISTKSVFPHV